MTINELFTKYGLQKVVTRSKGLDTYFSPRDENNTPVVLSGGEAEEVDKCIYDFLNSCGVSEHFCYRGVVYINTSSSGEMPRWCGDVGGAVGEFVPFFPHY